jgi:hypothetical protein
VIRACFVRLIVDGPVPRTSSLSITGPVPAPVVDALSVSVAVATPVDDVVVGDDVVADCRGTITASSSSSSSSTSLSPSEGVLKANSSSEVSSSDSTQRLYSVLSLTFLGLTGLLDPERGPSGGRSEVGDSTAGPSPIKFTPSVIPSAAPFSTPNPGYFFVVAGGGTSRVGVLFPEFNVDPRRTGSGLSLAWDANELDENKDDNLFRPL